MRLYLTSESSHHIAYTPDTLIVGNTRYDIQGDTDNITDFGLTTRTKGELYIYDETFGCFGDFREMTDEEIKYLVNQLDSGGEVIVSIYPFTEEDKGKLECDTLINGGGLLMIKANNTEYEVTFKFRTEFYGL